MIGMIPDSVEQRFAHVESGAIQHDGGSVVFQDQFIDRVRVSRREDLVTEVSQGERQTARQSPAYRQSAIHATLFLDRTGARQPGLLSG